MKFLNRITKGNNRSVAVKKNIVGSLAVKGFSIVISLMLVPMTLGYVSSELYGVWLTLSSMVIWLHFFDVGFTTGLKNKLAEAIALNEWERGCSLVSTTYFMMLLIFVPMFFVLEAMVPMVNWAAFLNVNEIYNDEIQSTLYVLVACFCFQMIFNVITAVIAAFQKVALSSSFGVIGNFFSLIAIFFITKFCPPSLVALACTISLMPVIVVIIASFILYSRKFKSVRPSIEMVRKDYVKDILGLGSRFFIIQIQFVVMTQMTNFLISNVSGPNEVTSYNIAYKYVGIALMLYNIVLTPLWPAFTDAYTRKDYIWMNRIYKKMTKFCALSSLAIVVMVAISPIAYSLWIGNRAEIPWTMTILVAIYVIIHSWDSLQVMLINGTGCVKLQTYVTLIGLIFHIPLSFLLGKKFGLGAYGVVISMTGIVLLYFAFFSTQINKILKQKAVGIWIQ